MESDYTWRKEEIIFFKNKLSDIEKEEDKNKYRKSLVLILYSHFEGFTKICLLNYIQFLNSLKLQCKDMNANLAVSSLEKIFMAYDSNDRKCKVFKNPLPENDKLHKIFRRIDLIENISLFQNEIAIIPDDAINTESNLWYIVLQKNLYKVGLPIDIFDEFKKDIDGLVNRRNSIAHGSIKSGVNQEEYNTWEKKIFYVMDMIILKIYNNAKNKKYLKAE